MVLGHVGVGDDDQQRALVPLRVRHADDRRLDHAGAADRGILEVDRANPFAARLDHILGAVDDLHVAVGVDRRDVAGVEPAVGVEDVAVPLAVAAAEVARDDPRTLDQQAPEAGPVARLFRTIGPDDLHLDAEQRATLLGAEGDLVGERQCGDLGRRRAERADRRHLGHPPELVDGDAMDREGLDHRPWHRRPADVDPRQLAEAAAVRGKVLEEREPDRRHGEGEVDALVDDQPLERRGVEVRAIEHQRRPGKGGRIGHAPRVDVEHWCDRQHHRPRAERHDIGPGRGHGMEHGRPVAVEDALGVAGRAAGVAQPGGFALGEVGPGQRGVAGGEQVFVAEEVEAARRHVVAVGEDDEGDAGQARRDPLDERQEGQVEQQDAVARVRRDIDDLVVEQPRVDRVCDGTHAADAVQALDVAPRVPGERRHPVAAADAEPRQRRREPPRPRRDAAPGRAVDAALDREADDFASRVVARGVVEQPRRRQRPVLHRADHRLAPKVVVLAIEPGCATAVIRTGLTERNEKRT